MVAHCLSFLIKEVNEDEFLYKDIQLDKAPEAAVNEQRFLVNKQQTGVNGK
jgi:hypothetical protein